MMMVPFMPKRTARGNPEDPEAGGDDDVSEPGGEAGGRVHYDELPKIMGIPLPDLGMQVGIGSVCGFASGYALKKVGKTLALALGVGFIGLQVAQYYGIIKKDAVDWKQLDERFRQALDTDDDGQITQKDIWTHLNRVIEFLGAELPSGAAFGVAFIMGLRYG